MKIKFRAYFFLLLFLLTATAFATSQITPSAGIEKKTPQLLHQLRLAVPLEPATTILNAFHSHSLVAIDGAAHGDEQFHAFLRSLISDPRFANTANDIVVEWGNAQYQDLIDRFVQGGNVSHDDLRQIWQNTTQPNYVWDSSIYEEFFQTVRTVNASLPKEKQLRVLLGDPPIDWNNIHSKKDLSDVMLKRNAYPAQLIQREVLNHYRRALIIYGGIHLQRKNIFSNYENGGEESETLISLLEKTNSTRVFTIWTAADLENIQANIATWPTPSIAIIRGTKLGAADFTWYYPYKISRGIVLDGKYRPIVHRQWRPQRMEDQFDAVMHAGSSSSITISYLTSSTCSDTAYMRMRISRMLMSGASQSDANKLKKNCAITVRTPGKKESLKEYLRSQNAVPDPILAKWWKISK